MDFLIPLAYLYWKWLVIITSKSITHCSEKTVCFICHHSSQLTMILSWYYTARGGSTMNYAKKVVIFYHHAYFFVKNTWQYKKFHKIYTLCAFIFFIFKHRVKLKKKKFWITTNKKVTKRVVWEHLQRDNYHAHSTGTFRTQSNI